MPSQEWPSEGTAEQERIAKLIEAGEAIDRADAEEAIWESSALAAFCERDYAAYAEELDRTIGDPQTHPVDRYRAGFWRAGAETAQQAQDSWELEFVANNVLLDFRYGESDNPQEQARLASSQNRLGKKDLALAGHVGPERAKALSDKYLRRLQELVG